MRGAGSLARAVIVVAVVCIPAAPARALDGSREPPERRWLAPPSFECPEAKGKLPEGASAAIAGFLGGDATPICLGDLNGNGRPEVLAAVSERTFGRGLGFYWVTRKSGVFEAGADKRQPWKPLLLTSDRVENSLGVIGWKGPVDKRDGIGLRFTMTGDKDRICLQLRRLDSNRHRAENPLVLVRWESSVERYEEGRCSGGTAGRWREVSADR